jgi:hypothetical protein
MWVKTTGDLDDISAMRFETVDFIMQDVGTPGHTQFENGLELIDIIEAQPELRKCRMGLIHSHNTMKAFFSGEDLEELDDNSEGTDFYVSLIVNNVFEPVCKIAFRGKTKKEGFIERSVKTVSGMWKDVREEISENKEVLFTCDVEVDIPELKSLDEDIFRFQEAKKARQLVDTSKFKPKGSEDKNSGPPYFISERQQKLPFTGTKEDAEINKLMEEHREYISPKTFADFVAKWISADMLFEGSIQEACMKVKRHLVTDADIQLYSSYLLDNMASNYESIVGDTVLTVEDELVVAKRAQRIVGAHMNDNDPVSRLYWDLAEKVKDLEIEMTEEGGEKESRTGVTETYVD